MGGEDRLGWFAASLVEPRRDDGSDRLCQGNRPLLAAFAVLCRALVYAEQRFGELEMPCQVRESGLGDVGQLGIILVADRGFLHAGPWVSGEGGDGDDESVRGRGEWLASAVQARF